MKKLYSLAIASFLGVCGFNAAAITADDLAGTYSFDQGTWYDYYVFSGVGTASYLDFTATQVEVSVDGNTVTFDNFGSYDEYPYSIVGTFNPESQTIQFDAQEYAYYYQIIGSFDGWWSCWSNPGYFTEDQLSGFTATVEEDGTIRFPEMIIVQDYYNNGCYYPYDYTTVYPVLVPGVIEKEETATDVKIEDVVGTYVVKSFAWWDYFVFDYQEDVTDGAYNWRSCDFAGDTVTVTADGNTLTFANLGAVTYQGVQYPQSIIGTFDPETSTINFEAQTYAWYYILCGQGDGTWYDKWAATDEDAARGFTATIGTAGTINIEHFLALYPTTAEDGSVTYGICGYNENNIKLTKIAAEDNGEEGRLQESLAEPSATAARYFNLQGMEVANPSAHGIYIVRSGNRSTKIVK